MTSVWFVTSFGSTQKLSPLMEHRLEIPFTKGCPNRLRVAVTGGARSERIGGVDRLRERGVLIDILDRCQRQNLPPLRRSRHPDQQRFGWGRVRRQQLLGVAAHDRREA